MKIKIKDRILAALLAILLLAGAAAIVAQTFFAVPITDTVKKLTAKNETFATKILPGVIAAVLLLLAVCCLTVLFRHKKKKDRFIRQVTEGGELQIGLDALSNLVNRCLEQHPEITPEKVSLDNERNSLTVNIAGNVSGGISIPLTVSQLQKQIKQYVTACSGVEVKNVRVTIRNTGADAKDAPFAIESPALVPRLKSGTDEEAPASTEETQTVPSQEAASTDNTEAVKQKNTPNLEMEKPYVPENESPAMDETEDDRPLHQRLFSQPEEPCIVPCPPVMKNDDQAETPAKENNVSTMEETEISFEGTAEDISELIDEVADPETERCSDSELEELMPENEPAETVDKEPTVK